MIKHPARTLLAAAALIGALTLTSCAPTENATTPTPEVSSSATPTPTPTTVEMEPPANEAEATAAAENTIEKLLILNAEVSAGGGADPSPYESVATGKALEIYVGDAKRIANGPILNEDQESIEGQSTVEGALVFEATTAYGQEHEGIANGLVTVPGCLDNSQRLITTADGKAAMKNPNPRNAVEYQVIYIPAEKTWKVFNEITTGATC